MSDGSHRLPFMSMALFGLMMVSFHCTAQVQGAGMAAQLLSNSAPAGDWTSGGPGGGSVLTLAIDPVNSDILYAGTVAGIFKSTDGGTRWLASNAGLGSVSIDAIAIYPGNPDILYAGGNDTRVFKSTDGGASWNAPSPGLYQPFIGYGQVRVVKVSPRNPNLIYAGTEYPGGLFKSTDGGASWNAINNPLGDSGIEVWALAMDANEPDTLYVETLHIGAPTQPYSGVFKSTDGGTSWFAAYLDLPATPSEIVIDPGNSNTLYAGTSNGLAKSTDGGLSWNIINAGIRVRSLAVDPKNPGTIYAGTIGGGSLSGVIKSVDAGATWSAINSNLFNTGALVIDSRSTVYAGTYGGGVFKSTDAGAQWTALNTGLNGTASALLVDRANPNTVYAGLIGGGLFKSFDYGASWSALNPSVPAGAIFISDLQADPFDANILYAAAPARFEGNFRADEVGVLKSTDGGVSWNRVNNGLPTGVYALAMDPSNQNTLYAGTGSGLYRSSDGSATWSRASNAPAGSIGQIFRLAVDPGSANTIYGIGCNAGDDFCEAGPGLHKSTDGGKSWTASISHFQNLYPELFPNCVAIDLSDSRILYVGTGGLGVYKSTDGGASWSASNTGIGNLSVNAIVIDPVNTGTLYAGTDRQGVFRSTNAGATWSDFNTGLTNLSVSTLAIDSLGRFLHAGTAAGVSDYQMDASRPTLALDKSTYCIGESWKLNILNAPASTSILLAGVLDGNPWSLPDWGITDQNGGYNAGGTYTHGNEGNYQVYAEVGGKISNILSVSVSNCAGAGDWDY